MVIATITPLGKNIIGMFYDEEKVDCSKFVKAHANIDKGTRCSEVTTEDDTEDTTGSSSTGSDNTSSTTTSVEDSTSSTDSDDFEDDTEDTTGSSSGGTESSASAGSTDVFVEESLIAESEIIIRLNS